MGGRKHGCGACGPAAFSFVLKVWILSFLNLQFTFVWFSWEAPAAHLSVVGTVAHRFSWAAVVHCIFNFLKERFRGPVGCMFSCGPKFYQTPVFLPRVIPWTHWEQPLQEKILQRSTQCVCVCECKRRSYNVASSVCFCARQEKIL